MVEPLSLGLFVIFTIVFALVFDFVNGFHDSANAIATVVATKVLTPLQAVVMAAFFNFVGPFLFSLAVANTVGKGVIVTSDPGVKAAFVAVIFSALLGAIIWDLVTWWYGLPTSSSHALVGGLVGAALAAGGPAAILLPKWSEVLAVGEWAIGGAVGGLGLGVLMLGWSRLKLPKAAFAAFSGAGAVAGALLGGRLSKLLDASGGKLFEAALQTLVFAFMLAALGALLWVATQQRLSPKGLPAFAVLGAAGALVTGTLSKALALGGLTKTLLFMVVSPVLGFFAGFLLAAVVNWTGRESTPGKVDRVSRRLQLVSSAFYALTHGTNDAQKTMGVIGVLLFGAGAISLTADGNLDIPTWVIVASAAAMGLGTMFGGWRIVHTMANRITALRPAQGFAAETGGGVVLVAMAQAGIPVSTTHAISSSIMGVGATRRMSAVRWGVGRRIVAAWIVTIPASAVVAFATYLAVSGPVAAVLDTPTGFGLALAATALGAGVLMWASNRPSGARTPSTPPAAPE